MGSLKRFNLKRIRAIYNCPVLFETGTWKGDGVAYALKHGFKKIYSSEIVSEIADRAVKRFENYESVIILSGHSVEVFAKTLPNINDNIIFWLDAHFPGAEEGLADYNAADNEEQRLPLQKEIESIIALRPKNEDVFLIDDLRIYEDGPYKSGNMPSNIIPPSIRNINFIWSFFSDSHVIKKSNEDEGYLIILPRKAYFESNSETFWQRFNRKFNKNIY